MRNTKDQLLWFDDIPVLGDLPPDKAALKLREMDEVEAAGQLEDGTDDPRGGRDAYGKGKRRFWPFQDKPWQHTAHAFGYLEPASPGSGTLPIQHVSNISADASLRNSRIKITLDHFRVADYPGGGTHRVLFDFYAQNQVSDDTTEHLHFNATYRAREAERVAVRGHPIFVGLNVGTEGVAFKCFTVNVKNDDDETFLRFLESDSFKGGLKLATTMQPAIGLFSETALGVTRAIAQRNRNVPIQDFYLGLDFSNLPMRAPLTIGSYLAVQIPETFHTVWDWGEWEYNSANGLVVNKSDHELLIPYNYVVFSISRWK